MQQHNQPQPGAEPTVCGGAARRGANLLMGSAFTPSHSEPPQTNSNQSDPSLIKSDQITLPPPSCLHPKQSIQLLPGVANGPSIPASVPPPSGKSPTTNPSGRRGGQSHPSRLSYFRHILLSCSFYSPSRQFYRHILLISYSHTHFYTYSVRWQKDWLAPIPGEGLQSLQPWPFILLRRGEYLFSPSVIYYYYTTLTLILLSLVHSFYYPCC